MDSEEVVLTRTYISRGINTDNDCSTCTTCNPPPPEASTTGSAMDAQDTVVKSEASEGSIPEAPPKKVHWMARVNFSEARSKVNSCVFGEVPGQPVGSRYETRSECYIAGVHGLLIAGVHGDPNQGTYSIVLSGGYGDDLDFGETFMYTGVGGRRTDSGLGWGTSSKQVQDQSWAKNGNASLRLSYLNQKPVRVIRGRCQHQYLRNMFMPAEHELRYRYDGLYVIEKAYQERGESGFLMCKFQFKRLPNQPPIPINQACPPQPILAALNPSQSEGLPVTEPDATGSISAPVFPAASIASAAPGPSELPSMSAPPIVKKRRGRRPGSKNVKKPLISPTISSSSSESTTSTVTVDGLSQSTALVTLAKPQRRRGRPRKVPLVPTEGNSAQQTPATATTTDLAPPLPTPASSIPPPLVAKEEQPAWMPSSLLALTHYGSPEPTPPPEPLPADIALPTPAATPASLTIQSEPTEAREENVPRPPWWNHCMTPRSGGSSQNAAPALLSGEKGEISSIKLEDIKEAIALSKSDKSDKSDVVLQKLEIGSEEALLGKSDTNAVVKGTKRPFEDVGNLNEDRSRRQKLE